MTYCISTDYYYTLLLNPSAYRVYKSLKISKTQSESMNRRRADDTMAKEKRQKENQ